jgi:hypothetical protein
MMFFGVPVPHRRAVLVLSTKTARESAATPIENRLKRNGYRYGFSASE